MKNCGKISGSVYALAIMLTVLIPQASFADCESLKSEINSGLDQIRGKQRAGLADTQMTQPNYVEQDVKDVNTKITSFMDQGCRPDPQWRVKQFVPSIMKSTPVEFPSSTLGGGRIGDAASYTSRSVGSLINGINLPIINPGLTLPTFDFPYSDQNEDNGNPDGTPTLDCGDLASKFAKDVQRLTGDNKAQYKDDCAGVDKDGHPRSSPNKATTVCNGKQYGKFGLIFASYNNKYTTANVNDLWYQSPSQAANSSTVVAYNNPVAGTKSAGTCSLSNIRTCGQPGDIIMLQSNVNMTPDTPYNMWMLYDGQSFIEMQNDSQTPVRRGGLRTDLNSMPYEIRRLSCSR